MKNPEAKNPEPDKPLLRLLFAGTPAIALPSLKILAEGAKAGRWQLVGILTNCDKAKGRSGSINPSEVGVFAETILEEFAALKLPIPLILKFDTLQEEARRAVYSLKPDLLVSFAYGRIFGPKFMALFPMGGINIHPSLLPKYRGASPIQEAILRRDSETGITIQRIAMEMDAGDILVQETIPLSGRETTASLSDIAATRGAVLLDQILDKLPQGAAQQGEATYCFLLKKESGLIDWNKSAAEIDAQIRSCYPWPLAYTSHKGKILNILEAEPVPPNMDFVNMLDVSGACAAGGGPSAVSDTGASAGPTPCCSSSVNMLDVSHACAGRVLGIDKKYGILVKTGDGILALTQLQYQTRKVLSWQAFLNGARDFIGSCLGI